MKLTGKLLGSATLTAILALGMTGCGGSSSSSSDDGVTATQKTALLTAYADMVNTTMTATIADAEAMQTAIEAFAEAPSESTLNAAKQAWLTARESYGVTEAYRFSNGPIDAEDGWVAEAYGALEGQINAWPLDENMIDYTVDANGDTTSGNIIDTAGSFTPSGGTSVDVTSITKEAIAELNENGGEANVASGYHAIEFLLWGQDQDYNSFIDDTVTNGPTTAGQRAVTDYTSADNANRRVEYLIEVTDLLIDDLKTVASAWSTTASTDCDTDATGCYRAALLGELEGSDASKNIAADTALKDILGGLGTFIKSELANERVAIAVILPSEEDEHSCFSDNTHRDIALNYESFINVLNVGGSNSMYALSSSSTQSALSALTSSIQDAVDAINDEAPTTHFDYQIKDGSSTKSTIIAMKNDMRDLGDLMINVANTFGITLTEDDVTDPEETQI